MKNFLAFFLILGVTAASAHGPLPMWPAAPSDVVRVGLTDNDTTAGGTARLCEQVTFGKKTRTVNGSTAGEIFATEALAGIPPDGAAGSNFESLTKLSCTIDPNAIRRKDGSGADCTFQPGN